MRRFAAVCAGLDAAFPFLFGGTFIEAANFPGADTECVTFPFLFGGTFIEAADSLGIGHLYVTISLPFRRDFH